MKIKQKIMGVFAAVMLAFVPFSAHAAAQLTATHSIVTAPTAQSSGVVTLNLSITNASATTLSNVTVTGTGGLAPADSATGSLSIMLLPAGQTVTVPWSLTVKQYSAQGFLRLLVSGLDDAGNAVTIGMTSMAGTQ